MRLLPLTLILCLLGGTLQAQKPQERKERARAYLSYGRYAEAVKELRAHRRLLREDKEAQLWLAVATYETNELATAEATLSGLLNKEEPEFAEVLWYLGRVYHDQHRFTLAAEYYKRYLRRLRAGDDRRQMVIEQIRRCDLGKEFQYQPARIVAENLGGTVNGPGDEYGPIPSPKRGDLIYFSARREDNTGGRRDATGDPDPQWGTFNSDLFRIQRQTTGWTSPQPLNYLLNTPQDEELLDFSADGRSMYYSRGRFGDRQYYVDPFREDEEGQLNTLPLSIPLRPNQGDRTPFFVGDTAVYFASARSGGYGGLDIYRMAKRSGTWLRPENLGPDINSPFDETTPFLAPDGRTLYFSSNDSYRSIGGFDVLTSYYLPETDRWTRAENLGMPLNSAGDDTHFRLVRDGFTGLLASSRKDGLGGMDLYVIYFQDFQEAAEPAAPSVVVTPPPAASPPSEPMPSPSPGRTIRPVTTSPPVVAAREPVADPSPPPLDLARFRYERQLPTDANTRYRLNQALALLNGDPELNLVVSAATASLASGVFFGGMTRARLMGTYFTERGIAPQRIFLRSIPQPAAAGTVGLSFAGPGAATRGDLPKSAGLSPYDQPLLYKVQIVATQRAYQGRDLGTFSYPMIESLPEFAFHRYTLGAFTDFTTAKAYRDELTATGFKGAYVVAYVYGQRLEGPALDRWVATFPDLESYLTGE